MEQVGSDGQVARGRRVARTVAALRRAVWALDVVAAAGAMLLAYAVSPVVASPWLGAAANTAAVYGVAFLVVAYAAGLYDWRERASPAALLVRILVVASLAAVATLGFFYLVFYRPIGRYATAAAVALAGPLVLLPRLAILRVLRSRPTRVLLLGRGPLAAKLEEDLRHGTLYEAVRLEGELATAPEALAGLCRARGIDEIVLPGDARKLAPVLLPALRCLPLGCRIRSEADFHEDLWSAVPVEHVGPDWMLSRGLDTSSHVAEAVKRLTDVILALLILVPFAPFALLAMLAIAVSSDGPIFYRQERVGRYGRTFWIWKLRTMRVDAEAAAGAQWASDDDPRRTAVGRLLRRTHLDEVPQVLNILLGEMSFVGPRPERPEFVAQLETLLPYYSWRHFVRPGLTGWAQVNLPYGSSIEDARRKLEYDLYYVRHYSLLTDFLIVLRTAAAALRGAR
jgi:exopolysaccharide biosynthesis polyprenyl glycosylphosphotransferase